MKPPIININKRIENLFILHRISVMWISKLEFYFDEYRYFHDLITMYSLYLLDTNYLKSIQKIENKLTESVKTGNLLLLEIQTHEKQLATLFSNKRLGGERQFRKIHSALAKKFDSYVQDNKSIKNDLFMLIKAILKIQKQKKLIPHISPTG